MGVLFEKTEDDKYKDWSTGTIYDSLNARDKISDIIVTHSRISMLLFDSITYLSEQGDTALNQLLESDKVIPKKLNKKQFFSNLGKNVDQTMYDKECPYLNFWQKVKYYNDWCSTGENWNIIQNKLALHSLWKLAKNLKIACHTTDDNEFLQDLKKMNDLRNRIAHGDIAVRLASEKFHSGFDNTPTSTNNVFTDVDLIYVEYMDIAEKWKPVFDAGESAIIEAFKERNNEK